MKKFFMMAVCVMALCVGFTSCSKDDDGNPVVNEWESSDVNTFDLKALEGEWVNVENEFETISFTNVTEFEGNVAWVQQNVQSGKMSKVTNYVNTVFFYLGQAHYRLVLTWNDDEKSQFTMKNWEGEFVGMKLVSPKTFKKK